MVFRFQISQKKEMDTKAAKEFWQWFTDNEKSIIDRLRSDARSLVFEIDQKLRPIFPYFSGELEFQLGFNDGRGEFFFFHFGKRYLIRDGETLGSLMPEELRGRWRYMLGK